MTEPNREAVKAARDALKGCGHDVPLPILNAALAVFQAHLRPPAALPFLAPQPTQSDEEAVDWTVNNFDRLADQKGYLLAFAAAVRAEATLAAQKEFDAQVIEDGNQLAAKDAQIAALTKQRDELAVSEARYASRQNHDETVVALREALGAIEPYQDKGGHWCVRCGDSFWLSPAQDEAERVEGLRRAALEMSGGVL